jgi:hypothetical protein
VEKGLNLFDGLLQSGVVLHSPDSPLHLVGRMARLIEHSTKEARCAPQQAPDHAHRVGSEGGHIAVTATIAMKFELEAHICRKILVILGKFNGCHEYLLNADIITGIHSKPETSSISSSMALRFLLCCRAFKKRH